MKLLRILAVLALAWSANTASAAFTLITGTGSVTTSGTGVTTVATSGTGNISSTNFLSWSVVGPDSVNGGSNTLGSFSTSSGTPIAAVYLVSNGANPTLSGVPATLANTANSNLQRRTAPNTFSGDFSPPNGEPLLFANAGLSGIIIDFGDAVAVQGAGFRVQQGEASLRNDFFIQAYSGTAATGYSSVFGANDLFVDSTSPGANNAPFYGIMGGDPSETFNRLFIGFSDPVTGPAFAISTLEVLGGNVGPQPPNAVPVPPTVFAGLFGMISLAGSRWIRRRRI